MSLRHYLSPQVRNATPGGDSDFLREYGSRPKSYMALDLQSSPSLRSLPIPPPGDCPMQLPDAFPRSFLLSLVAALLLVPVVAWDWA